VQFSQIENEYGNIKKDHITDGDKYLEWAAQMALSTNTGVPWIMCKQSSAPGEVVTLLLNIYVEHLKMLLNDKNTFKVPVGKGD
jgi:hypothetical protein